jgi:hypothetical protein
MANDIVVNGSASAPTAGTAVVSSSALTHGRYRVVAQVHLEGSGTPAAADLDNMALYSDTTEVAVLAVPEAKAVLFTSPEIVTEVAAGKVLSVQAVGNATASVVYSATLRAHPEALYP